MLKIFSEENVFNKGLLYSSHSFIERLESFRKKPFNEWRKKEFQTARTITQYLSRICAKTSPFASFTNVAFGFFQEEEASPFDNFYHTKQSNINPNERIRRILIDYLNKNEAYKRNQWYKLNESLIQSVKEYRFYHIIGGKETIQHLERDPIIDKIISEFQSILDEITNLESLIDNLLKSIDAEESDIEKYLLSLVEIGLLVPAQHWNVPFSWIYKLSEVKGIFHNKDINADIDSLVLKLIETKDILANPYDPLQKTILENLHQFLNNFDPAFHSLSKEQLMFEDTYLRGIFSFQEAHFVSIANQINLLQELCAPIVHEERQKKLLTVAESHFTNVYKIDLLAFFEAYYSQKTEYQSSESLIEYQNELHQLLNNAIVIINGEILLNSNILEIGLKKLKTKAVYPVLLSNSRAALVQYNKDEKGSSVAVVNASSAGYGKIMNRFLNHEFLDFAILKENKSAQEKLEGCIFANLNDNSFFNANIINNILPYTIDINGIHTITPFEGEDNILYLNDLYVQYQKNNGQVRLHRNYDSKQVIPFDMGLELPIFRSQMYQLLSLFGFPTLTHRPILQYINENYFIENDKLKILPRIKITDNIIIQRKQWHIPRELIPFQGKNEVSEKYQQRLNNWRKSFDIPDYVFIKINDYQYWQKESENNKKELAKPQYIDFESIILVDIFARQIKLVPSYLIIEEMLPTPNELLDFNGENYVSEIVIQWNI